MLSIISKENRSYLMGFSILWIIAYHFCSYSNLLQNPVFDFLFGKGYLGVDIFLFLSAFGLCFSYTNGNIGSFYKKRFFRLFPMYFLFLVIVLSLYGKYYDDSFWKLFLFQITGLSCFRTVDVEWYIPALILFYLSFPFLYKGVKWLYLRSRTSLVILILVVEASLPLLEKVCFPAFPQRFAIFLIGIVTYFATKDESDDKQYLIIVFVSAALFAFLFDGSAQQVGSMILPLIIYALSQIRNLDLPAKEAISFLGKHSLEIYLAQSIALNQFFLHSDINYKLKVLIATVIIVTLSIVFHYFHSCCLSFIGKR